MVYKEAKKKIRQAYLKCKINPFNQAILFDVFKASSLKADVFVDTIWQLFKIEQQIWFLSARRRRGILKQEIKLINALIDKYPEKQRRRLPLPRYMAWRDKK